LPILVRGRVVVLLLWAAIVLVLFPEARRAGSRFEVGTRMAGSAAASVEEDLAKRFRSPYVHPVLLVATGLPSAASSEGLGVLTDIVRRLNELPGITSTLSYVDAPDPIFLGEEGGSIVLVGLDSAGGSPDSLVPPLRRATSQLVGRLRKDYPEAALEWTGETPLNFDLRRVSSEDARLAERRIAPVVLLLLVAAFGSFIAAMLPIAVGVLAIVLTLGVSGLLARHWHLSILVQNLASMIGLGLGIDYALLMVSRFREALARGSSVIEAADESIRRAGHTLLLSAAPVAIGFAALLTVPVSELRSIGVAGILVTAFTLLVALTLLPLLLVWLGGWVGAGGFFRGQRGPASDDSRVERWRRWGRYVASHPKTSLVLAGAPVLLLASQGIRLDTGTLAGDWLPPEAEAVRALHHLEDMDRANVIMSVRLILDLPVRFPIDTEEGWAAMSHLTQSLQDDPRIERVHSLRTVLGEDASPEFIESLPPSARNSLVSTDRRATFVEILPARRPRANQTVDSSRRRRNVLLRRDAEDLARAMQRLSAPKVTGLEGTRLRVGGLAATNAEFEDVITRRFRSVLGIVIGATLLALFVGFRSLLVAVKAVVLNLLSVGASFGALVLVFQDGLGARLLGLEGPTERVFTIVPILVFCIVFGLSMDYEVFLVARVAEARRSGLDETAAISEAVARTGRLITSAAAIMFVVFAGFTFGVFLPIKMLGFALAVAVLLDATIVRMVIGPALLSLAGRWNWWPGQEFRRDEAGPPRNSQARDRNASGRIL
jgi:putative drug exporter of the RND superfamily